MYLQLDFLGQKYDVLDYGFDTMSEGGDTMLSNCVPLQISVTVEIGAKKNPAGELFAFAADQHSVAKEKGKGSITVKKAKDVGDALQVIEFTNAWISGIGMNVGTMNDKFTVNFMISPSTVKISDVAFEHKGRLEHFEEA
jgi:hypothetical protein